MHAISHSLAHRAPAPAARARARCPQQYHLSAVATSQPTPLSVYLTPCSSSTVSIPTPHLRHQSSVVSNAGSSSSSSSSNLSVSAQRNRFASGLVDLAVKALCDIWPSRIIPSVFATGVPPRVRSEHASGPFADPVPSQAPVPTQLPSPPNSPDASSSTASFDEDGAAISASMRGFVIEVLRRSRSSTSVLQTALCYMEAIQSKVNDLAMQELAGTGVRGEEDQGARLVIAPVPLELREPDIEDILEPASYEAGRISAGIPPHACGVQMVADPPPPPPCHSSKKPRTDISTLPPIPPLPSPLLDPRRTFIAALVLASKFAQDKCYSNRAWAKLAGLPPREIGRCERALGDALGWRLWVGKQPMPQTTRPLGRARSECNVMATAPPEPSPAAQPSRERPLRRSSTLPAAAFQPTAPAPAPPPLPAAYLKQVSASDVVPFASTMQGPWMPVMQSPSMAPRQWLEPTPQLSASPATTESSIDEQRTVQLFDLPEMPGMGVNDAKGPPPPPYTLLQSSVGSFGSEGGIAAPGWAGASQEWSWGIPV